MILISATPSPFARKVRMALIEKGIAFTLQNEVPWHADTQTPRYNPLEQLPILIPDDGDPVFESTFLMDWLEHKYPEPSMLPADPERVLEAKLIHTIAEGVADATVLLFWEMQREHISTEWAQRQLRKVKGGLTDLNRRVGDRVFFVDDRFGLADIAVIALLGMQDIVINTGMITAWQNFAPDMDDWNVLYPNLERFDAHHRDRPSVKQTAPFMFDLAEKIV
ncbi:glutathione S-transferase N-terminal domain-containing protein [Sphingorhabdus sp. EL138]|uniref:glutathione S-transferase N-terminal domain-containing protein n=1 Tax=Sphingorhabdus sp. EL138 TaxID=2073156 RepID=UPI0025E87881|nr:glutathione S-transferase N-terminal domain-containing protein [Sphingorhabdus sp. EL138]